MSKEKNKESSTNVFYTGSRFRWVILLSVTILFSIILFPNLVTPNFQYYLGDVAERDIKAPRDFFIEDQQATELNRLKAVESVQTVYDFDPELGERLSQNVDQVFAEMQAAYGSENAPQEQSTANDEPSDEVLPKDNKPAADSVMDKRKYMEEKLGIRISKGAFTAIETAGFSVDIAAYINKILLEILNNGVVTNKEIFLKEAEKGIILRDVGTKEEQVVHQLKQFYGLDQAKTMVRINGQPYLKDLDYSMLNLIVDVVQRLIQPNITLNRNETQERKNKAAASHLLLFYEVPV